MFLARCVTPEFKELVLSYYELVPCLQNLATYCANEEVYCKRKLGEMKAAKLSRTYRDDKDLICMFDGKLIQITSIDNSFHVNFSTMKVIIHKLSSNTIKDRLKSGLEDVKRRDKDRYNTNNYLLTLRQLLNIARSHVDEELDTRALDNFTNRRSEDDDDQAQEVQINRTQFSSPQRKGGRGKPNNANERKGNYGKRDRSSDDDDNSAYHINEFGDKVYGYKKKKPAYQKPRVNNFTTSVTEGGHK